MYSQYFVTRNRFSSPPPLSPLRNPIHLWAHYDDEGPELRLRCEMAGDETLAFTSNEKLPTDRPISLRVGVGVRQILLTGRILEAPVLLGLGAERYRGTLTLRDTPPQNLKLWRALVEQHRLRML